MTKESMMRRIWCILLGYSLSGITYYFILKSIFASNYIPIVGEKEFEYFWDQVSFFSIAFG